MNDIEAIKNYIIYLKKCGLSVTLHSHDSDILLKTDLLAFNIHDNPYCIYVKNCPAAQDHCVEKQGKIVEKCKGGPFTGVCYAGVKEFVYPVTFDGQVAGFICVSGYSCENGEEYISKVSEKYDLPKDGLKRTYGSLKSKMPERSFVDTLVYPLCSMLELAYLKDEYNSGRDPAFIRRVVSYIKKNYTRDITSETLCGEFECSRSHLSHVFNAYMKTSIRSYLNALRVEAAKILLAGTKLEISEVALSVGFSEPYYFTAVFKKTTGSSPSAYRRAEQKK